MFQLGEIVNLKSGGPDMTVTEHEESTDKVTCWWMAEDGDTRTGEFPAASLIQNEDPDCE